MPESERPQEVSFAPGRGARRGRRIGAGVALVAGSAVAVVIVLGAGPSSSQGASQAPKSSGAATVARRDLVSTDTEAGTLGYANAQTVFNRLSGTITSLPAVGKVIDPGQTLYRVDGAPVVLMDGGTPAYRDLSDGVTDGLDVQELKLNLKSLGFDPDHQITVNRTFDAATTAAVDRWQASLGETQTGIVTLGQIVVLPGPQRVTQVDTVLGSTGGSSGSAAAGAATTTSGLVGAPRAEFVDLSTAATTPTTSTTPATTTTGTGAGKTTTCPTSVTKQISTIAGDSRAVSQTKQAIAAICSQRTSSASKTAAQTLAALIALLRAETLQLKRSGAGSSTGTGTARTGGSTGASSGSTAGSGSGRSGGGGATSSGSAGSSGASAASGSSSSSGSGSSSGGGSSSSGGTAQAILQTTSTQLVVSVDLDATKQSEAVVGEPVSVQLPNGDTVNGKITGVSPVAQSASSSSGSSSTSSGGGGGSASSTPSATVPVTINLEGHQAERGLDQAAVSVNFQQQVENHVLSVPVTALLATSGGGYAVQETSAPHRLIPVTPGLFAAGYVQVSGAGIYPGLSVTDSQG